MKKCKIITIPFIICAIIDVIVITLGVNNIGLNDDVAFGVFISFIVRSLVWIITSSILETSDIDEDDV
jgi:hypothetical protein